MHAYANRQNHQLRSRALNSVQLRCRGSRGRPCQTTAAAAGAAATPVPPRPPQNRKVHMPSSMIIMASSYAVCSSRALPASQNAMKKPAIASLEAAE